MEHELNAKTRIGNVEHVLDINIKMEAMIHASVAIRLEIKEKLGKVGY